MFSGRPVCRVSPVRASRSSGTPYTIIASICHEGALFEKQTAPETQRERESTASDKAGASCDIYGLEPYLFLFCVIVLYIYITSPAYIWSMLYTYVVNVRVRIICTASFETLENFGEQHGDARTGGLSCHHSTRTMDGS